MRFLHLGASLYVPGTRTDLIVIANGRKYPHLRSVIFCTEDAIRPAELPLALHNIQHMLRALEPSATLRFLRVRNPAVFRTVLQMDGVSRLTGFVLPKINATNLGDYFSALSPDDPFELMPTLETEEVFNPAAMAGLRTLLLQDHYRWRILSLRIGGNDLLNVLGLRRPRQRTLYATPLATTINQLVTTFRPHGFNLTAPVFEYLDERKVLRREVRADLAHGLFGKSAIHPDQVPIIEKGYQVSREELHMAEEILDHTAPAVFRLHDAMCEPATHSVWARMICERGKIYGVRNAAEKKPANRNGAFPKNGTIL